MKKSFAVYVVISILFWAQVSSAGLGQQSLTELSQDSDIIIEGAVQDQVNSTTQYGGFKFFKLSHVRVEKVYKGSVSVDQVIDIYSHSDFFYDASVLEANKHYFLLLKKHGNGYVDAHYGQGQWLIENQAEGPMVKAPTKEELCSYDDFVRKLAEAINYRAPEKKKLFRWF